MTNPKTVLHLHRHDFNPKIFVRYYLQNTDKSVILLESVRNKERLLTVFLEVCFKSTHTQYTSSFVAVTVLKCFAVRDWEPT